MEVVGVVLGAFPLALSAIENYQKCLQLAKDYVRFEDTIKLIHRHIFVQQEQLNMTLRSIGLVNPDPSRLVVDLEELYPDKCKQFMDIVTHMESLLLKLMDKLDIDAQGKPKWTAEPPERAVWEWRRVKRSFGRSSRQRLIEELQFWNDALKLCFEKTELPLERDTPNSTLDAIQSRFNAQSCASVREHARDVHDAVFYSWKCQPQDHIHRGNLKLSWHTSGQPRPDEFSVSLSLGPLSSSSQPASESWQQFSFEVEDEKAREDQESQAREVHINQAHLALPFGAQHTTAGAGISSSDNTLHPRKRFKTWFPPRLTPSHSSDVEMTDASPELSSRSPSPSVSPRLLETPPEVNCLCSFLHDAKQLGRLKVAGREGRRDSVLRVERRLITDTQVETIPLSRILSPRYILSPVAAGFDIAALSRKDRFAVAAAATWAVLYLGDSPWISPNWDGKDLFHMVFENHVMLSRHYPSILFTARQTPIQPESTSNGPDSNAEELRFGLIRNRTIFALGILLIELCLNKPFDQLRNEVRIDSISNSLGLGTSPDDYEVANLQMQRVYLEAGDFYGYAVQRCLRCEFPGRDVTKNFSFDQFRKDFFSYVVAPVQATYILLPSSCFSL